MSRKDKDIPSWQKSTFDQHSRVETKPISVQRIKQIEKDFYHNNKEAMKIKDPDLYEFYKAEFEKNKKPKSNSNPILNKDRNQIDYSSKKNDTVQNEKHIVFKNELEKLQKQREMDRKKKLDQLRQEQVRPIQFQGYKKDPHRGMAFVSCHEPINKGKLGHSQSWKYKKEKKYVYYW